MSIQLFWALPLLAFAGAVFLTHALRPAAIQAGLVDHPGGRKRHRGAVPLVGGLAVFLAFAGASLLLPVALRDYVPLFVAMGVLVMTGLIDDLIDVRVSTKITAQVVAAVLVASWSGLTIESFGDLLGFGPVLLGEWAVPVTVFCLVGLVNAVNMIDGMDGLGGGVGLIALGVLGWACWSAGSGTSAYLAFILAGAVGGFLVFNLRGPWRGQASAFLGDSGSMMLGLGVGWFAVDASQVPGSPISPVTVLWILALPVIDTLSLMLRRIAKGQSPFFADREHLHHIFQRAGFGDGAAAAILLGLSAVLAGIGVAGSLLGVPDPVMLLGLVLLAGAHYYFIRHAWRVGRVLRRSRAGNQAR